MGTLTTRLRGHRVIITDYLVENEIPVKMAEIPGLRYVTRTGSSQPWPVRLELAYRSRALGRLLTTVVTDLDGQGLWSR